MNAVRNMRGPFWITLLALAPLVLMLAAACTARPPVLAMDLSARPQGDGLTKHFTGQIAEVGSAKMVVVDAVGEDHSFAVPHDATVMLNDTESSLDMLHAGLLATVHAESRGGEWVAISIHARRQY